MTAIRSYTLQNSRIPNNIHYSRYGYDTYQKIELHEAAEEGRLDLVNKLLRLPGSLKDQDIFGETPLHYAAENGHLEVVKALIDAGADPTSIDKSNRTPLDCAQQRQQNQWLDVSDFLSSLPCKVSSSVDQLRECYESLPTWVDDQEVPALGQVWNRSCFRMPCHECGTDFDEEAPVRTFSLAKQISKKSAGSQMKVHGHVILFRDRHLACVPKSCYLAVSHVWRSAVAAAHLSREDTLDSRQAVFDGPIRILEAAVAIWGDEVEIWHDYLSVPQWDYEMQQALLTLLPFIYSEAAGTIVHMSDVPMASIAQMQQGTTSRDKLAGLSTILNSTWYTRVWTCLEMIRSPVLHLLTAEYNILTSTHDLLWAEINNLYTEIVREYGDARLVERVYANGDWPLADDVSTPEKVAPSIRARRKSRMPFGTAYHLLTPKKCTVKHDIFVALLGLTGLGQPGDRLPEDNVEACQYVAFRCLENGDYSPLLISRTPGEGEPLSLRWLKGYTGTVFWSWGLGAEIAPPNIPPVLNAGRVTLSLERVGLVVWSKKFHFLPDKEGMACFEQVVQFAFSLTGRKMDEFARAVGTHVYGMDTEEILTRLNSTSDMDDLARAAQNLPIFAKMIPLTFSTVLPRVWDALDERKVPWEDLTDDSGLLEKLAEAMGLSSNELKKGVPYPFSSTPFDYASHDGNTAHGAISSGVVNVFGGSTNCGLLTVCCTTCHKHFLLRAAFFEKPSSLIGAILYRIPGLQYEASLADGVGIIVKNKRIFGRVIYAVRSCPCRLIETIELD